jgi:hypothetical protein
MTEQEWLICTDPEPMLGLLRDSGRASHRKLRLWACACVRRIWHLLEDVHSRHAVEVAERFSDATATFSDLKTAQWEAFQAAKAIATPPDAGAYYQVWLRLRAANSATGTSDEDAWRARQRQVLQPPVPAE